MSAIEWPEFRDSAYEVRRLRAILEIAIKAGDLPPGVVYLDPIHKPTAAEIQRMRDVVSSWGDLRRAPIEEIA